MMMDQRAVGRPANKLFGVLIMEEETNIWCIVPERLLQNL